MASLPGSPGDRLYPWPPTGLVPDWSGTCTGLEQGRPSDPRTRPHGYPIQTDMHLRTPPPPIHLTHHTPHTLHRLIPHPTHSISHSHTTQTSYCIPYSRHITAHHIYLLYTHHTLASCTTHITAHMSTKDQSKGAPGWAGRTESLRAGAR